MPVIFLFIVQLPHNQDSFCHRILHSYNLLPKYFMKKIQFLTRNICVRHTCRVYSYFLDLCTMKNIKTLTYCKNQLVFSHSHASCCFISPNIMLTQLLLLTNSLCFTEFDGLSLVYFICYLFQSIKFMWVDIWVLTQHIKQLKLYKARK